MVICVYAVKMAAFFGEMKNLILKSKHQHEGEL